jgi:hypothetical protein
VTISRGDAGDDGVHPDENVGAGDDTRVWRLRGVVRLETNEAWRSSESRRLAQSLTSSGGLNKTSCLFSYNGARRNGTGNNQVEDSWEKEHAANYRYLLKLLLDDKKKNASGR